VNSKIIENCKSETTNPPSSPFRKACLPVGREVRGFDIEDFAICIDVLVRRGEAFHEID
jgi:hypothetical protein